MNDTSHGVTKGWRNNAMIETSINSRLTHSVAPSLIQWQISGRTSDFFALNLDSMATQCNYLSRKHGRIRGRQRTKKIDVPFILSNWTSNRWWRNLISDKDMEIKLNGAITHWIKHWNCGNQHLHAILRPHYYRSLKHWHKNTTASIIMFTNNEFIITIMHIPALLAKDGGWCICLSATNDGLGHGIDDRY